MKLVGGQQPRVLTIPSEESGAGIMKERACLPITEVTTTEKASMNRVRTSVAITFTALLAALPLGCKSSSDNSAPSRGSSVDSGDVKLDIVPSTQVEIIQPTVEISGDTTTIAGGVHRKQGVSQALAGRIDIEFVDTDGEVLDSLPALLRPQKIPLDEQTPCNFHTEYGYAPPKGTTIRLHFVDSDTAAREDLAGGNFETGRVTGGTGGTHAGGNAHAAAAHIR
jgi:hypothetical protein